MKHLFKILLCITISSFSLQLYGQYNYRDGFIITLENDTLTGKIRDRGEIRNSKVCLYKPGREMKAIRYYPDEITAYGSFGDKYYSSKQIRFKEQSKPVFINVLLEGKVNLYYNWRDKNLSYYMEKEDGILRKLLNVDVQIQQNPGPGYLAYGGYTHIKMPVYRDTLHAVFQDNKRVQDQIKYVDYEQESLQNITRHYILETCEESNCINFEKDVNMYRPRFGLYTGFQLQRILFLSYNETSFSSSASSSTSIPSIVESDESSPLFMSYTVGISYNFPLFVFSDRLSFQLEMNTTGLNFEQEFPDSSLTFGTLRIDSRTLSIPLLLKYELARKKVSPSLAVGKSTTFVLNSKIDIDQNPKDYLLHTIQKGGWFFEFGLDYKLGPKISLHSGIRVMTYRNLIVNQVNQNPYYKSLLNNGDYLTEYRTNIGSLLIGIKF